MVRVSPRRPDQERLFFSLLTLFIPPLSCAVDDPGLEQEPAPPAPPQPVTSQGKRDKSEAPASRRWQRSPSRPCPLFDGGAIAGRQGALGAVAARTLTWPCPDVNVSRRRARSPLTNACILHESTRSTMALETSLWLPTFGRRSHPALSPDCLSAPAPLAAHVQAATLTGRPGYPNPGTGSAVQRSPIAAPPIRPVPPPALQAKTAGSQRLAL